MNAHEQDLLIGRLAMHFKLLDKAQVSDALRRKRAAGDDGGFGEFLVTEGLLPASVLPKLERARQQYLERQKAKEQAAVEEAPAPPVTAPPAAVATPEPPPVAAPDAPVEPTSEPVSEPVMAVPSTTFLGAAEPAAAGIPEAATTQRISPEMLAAASTSGRLGYRPGVELSELLATTCRLGASDLHVHSGAPLKLRLHGLLEDAGPEISGAEAERLVLGLLSEGQKERLEADQQVDFAFALEGVGRFRANAYRQQRGLDAVFRAIPPEPPTLAELGLPEALADLTTYHQGMVLLTGPAGCGKSSTMAALVRLINEDRPDHIITVEDPVEYVHASARCIVNQRQVGPHTESFARALRAALREDPDIIVIGELRDLETVSLALTAAETGHLVLGTLHTSSAVRTINRLLGVFPPEQQAQIRTMVSESLRAVVSQRLVRRADGEGRVAAAEVLINNKAIGNLIRENKTFQIPSIMQTGSGLGMRLLDNSLAELVAAGTVERDEALRFAEDPKRVVPE